MKHIWFVRPKGACLTSRLVSFLGAYFEWLICFWFLLSFLFIYCLDIITLKMNLTLSGQSLTSLTSSILYGTPECLCGHKASSKKWWSFGGTLVTQSSVFVDLLSKSRELKVLTFILLHSMLVGSCWSSANTGFVHANVYLDWLWSKRSCVGADWNCSPIWTGWQPMR